MPLTTVVITQPMLFPWPGFFEQLQLADVFIYLDDVQFSKGSFTNRVQMRELNKARWLTVPLVGKGNFQKICELQAVADDWRHRHEALAIATLKSAPWAETAVSLMREVYAIPNLAELLMSSVEASAKHLDVGRGRHVLRSSEMNVGGQSWRRVLDLVRAVDGTRYLTGHGAAQYLDHEAFEAAGVAVEYVDYSLTTWPRDGSEKTPYLSILDLIAWTGPNASSYLKSKTVPWRIFLDQSAADPASAS